MKRVLVFRVLAFQVLVFRVLVFQVLVFRVLGLSFPDTLCRGVKLTARIRALCHNQIKAEIIVM